MTILRRTILHLTAAAALAVSGTAAAAPINTALSVVIDGSNSISADDFQTQIDAYDSVFGNDSLVPADGSVVANLVQFSSEGEGIVEQTALRLNSETDRSTLLTSINGMSQINGQTDIQEGIDLGVNDMETFLGGLAAAELGEDFRKIVDVSTDGEHNQDGDPAAEAADAVNNQGYDAVNCLSVGAGSCSFIAGTDGTIGTGDDLGTVFSAGSFNDLQPVLEDKVGQELRTQVPTPAPLALLGIGLLALGATLRRRIG